MSKDPAMLFFGRDFYEDETVKLMSLEQEAVYLRLLWHAWREGSIPAAVDELAAIVRLPVKRFEKLWVRIAVKWQAVPLSDRRLVNKRQEHERQVRLERSKKLSEAGLNGNAARWGLRSPGDAEAMPAGDRQAIPSNPNPNPAVPSDPLPMVVPPCCSEEEQREDGSQELGPAGTSGTSLGEALKSSPYRANSKKRASAILAAVVRLERAGLDANDLMALAKRANRLGKNPTGLFAHWVDHPDEAVKELGKR